MRLRGIGGRGEEYKLRLVIFACGCGRLVFCSFALGCREGELIVGSGAEELGEVRVGRGAGRRGGRLKLVAADPLDLV